MDIPAGKLSPMHVVVSSSIYKNSTSILYMVIISLYHRLPLRLYGCMNLVTCTVDHITLSAT